MVLMIVFVLLCRHHMSTLVLEVEAVVAVEAVEAVEAEVVVEVVVEDRQQDRQQVRRPHQLCQEVQDRPNQKPQAGIF